MPRMQPADIRSPAQSGAVRTALHFVQRNRRKKSETRIRFSLYLLTFLVIFIDQATKAVILEFFATHLTRSVPVIKNIFHISLVHNTGIAFGLFQKNGMGVTALIFVCVLLLVMVSLKLRHSRSSYQWAYGLVMGGALSNFIDRLRFGYVVDFLDFQIWPVFNIADSCITIGIVILMVLSLIES